MFYTTERQICKSVQIASSFCYSSLVAVNSNQMSKTAVQTELWRLLKTYRFQIAIFS